MEAGDGGQPGDRCRARVRRQGRGRARPGGAARARAGPDPEPPEPEPPSPPTEGLEPPVAGATHVGLKVGPARQTVTAIGFGLGSPGGQSPAKTLEKHTKVLVQDPGAN